MHGWAAQRFIQIKFASAYFAITQLRQLPLLHVRVREIQGKTQQRDSETVS